MSFTKLYTVACKLYWLFGIRCIMFLSAAIRSVWLDTVAYRLYWLYGIRCIMFLLAAIRSITWATTSLHLWPAARTSSHSSDDQTQLSAKSAARPIIASVLGKYASEWIWNVKDRISWMCVGKFAWELTGGQASSNLCENLRIIHNAICPHPTVVRNVPNYRVRIASLPVQRSNLWIHQGTPLVLYSLSSIQVWKASKANSNPTLLNTNSETLWSHVVILN